MRAGIITISDRSAAGLREDATGPLLVKILESKGWNVEKTAIIQDDFQEIKELLIAWSDDGAVDLILTTGGTGFSIRDITPEATLDVVERQAPGLAEAMRSASMRITPHAMLSRAAAGIRKNVLIVNLPGSPNAARENLSVILPSIPHAVQLLHDDPASESGHRHPHLDLL